MAWEVDPEKPRESIEDRVETCDLAIKFCRVSGSTCVTVPAFFESQDDRWLAVTIAFALYYVLDFLKTRYILERARLDPL